MTGEEPPIIFNNVSKHYGDLKALANVSFSVQAGQILGLLGPNGAGKTTAAKLTVGLIQPSAGSVRLLGQPTGDNRLVADRIGYAADDPALYPKLTPLEMVDLVAALRGIPTQVAADKALPVLERLRFDMRGLERFTHTLSRGNKRKLGLALTLLHDPTVLVCDEPTDSLDALAVRELRGILDELRKRRVAVLLATNDLATAESLCDVVAMIISGEIRYLRTADEIRPNYEAQKSRLEKMFYEQISDD